MICMPIIFTPVSVWTKWINKKYVINKIELKFPLFNWGNWISTFKDKQGYMYKHIYVHI